MQREIHSNTQPIISLDWKHALPRRTEPQRSSWCYRLADLSIAGFGRAAETLGSLLKMHHLKVAEGIGSLPRDKLVLWERLEKSTTHPLHRSRASELFLEVLTLQDAGTEIDWPSIYCAITTLTRLDKGCLQARLAVGCSESPCLQACIVVQASRNISSNAVDLPQKSILHEGTHAHSRM